MFDECFGLNVYKLCIFIIVIIFHGLSIEVVCAADAVANITGYYTSLTSGAAYPLSTAVANAINSSVNGESDRLVNLVEAPAEVIGPRVTETEMMEKLERKRESGVEIGIGKTSSAVRASDDDEDDNDDKDELIVHDEDDDDEDEDDDAVMDDVKLRRSSRRKAGRKNREGPRVWDQWGKWTSCSVSCGAGKLTRWRHCVAGGCSVGEKEAQLKTCTFSAC